MTIQITKESLNDIISDVNIYLKKNTYSNENYAVCVLNLYKKFLNWYKKDVCYLRFQTCIIILGYNLINVDNLNYIDNTDLQEN